MTTELDVLENPPVPGANITAALRKARGNMTRAAELCGLSFRRIEERLWADPSLWPQELPRSRPGARAGRRLAKPAQVTEALLRSRGDVEVAAHVLGSTSAAVRDRLEDHPELWPEDLPAPSDHEAADAIRLAGGNVPRAAALLVVEPAVVRALVLRRPWVWPQGVARSTALPPRGSPQPGDADVTEAIRASGGRVAAAAEALGVGRAALWRKLRRRPNLWPDELPVPASLRQTEAVDMRRVANPARAAASESALIESMALLGDRRRNPSGLDCDAGAPPRKVPAGWPGAQEAAALAAPLLAAYGRSYDARRMETLRSACGRAGLDLIDVGSSRGVFALPGGVVLKVQYAPHLFLDRASANASEARVWREASEAHAAMLAPVLAADPQGAWLVMARTEPLGPWSPPMGEMLDPLRRRTTDHNVWDNASRWCGRVVLHDYAV